MTNVDQPSAPPKQSGRGKVVIGVTIGVVVALVILLLGFSSVFTDVLWYKQLGFLNVLTTQWVAAGVMFVLGFLGMAVPLWLSIRIAFTSRPTYVKLSSQLDRYQEIIDPLRKLLTILVPLMLGLFGGALGASRWETALTWLHATKFGEKDAQFGLDLGFYVFRLPFWTDLIGFGLMVLFLCGIATIVLGYLYGGIRFADRELRIAKGMRIQLAVIAGLYVLLQSLSIWMNRYTSVTDQSGRFAGSGYTDVHATLPGSAILAIIGGLVALLFFATAVYGRWRLPMIGTALLVVSALVIGMGYPWVVQTFQVEPSERTMEQEYLQRNIDATRAAYELDDIDVEEYDATTTAESGALRKDADTTASIRILDPNIVSDAFSQLEQFKQYYKFTSTLDVDRYEVDGQTQDTVIAVRELNQSGLGDSQSWYNNAIVYTHGYGVVAAYGNQRTVEGKPDFLEGGIPAEGDLGDFEPRIYFGENSPEYSIVGGTENGSALELDYPAGEGEDNQTYNTFDGDGGPKLNNTFKRLIYALKFQSEQIFLSDAVSDDSQILYDRDPVERVQKVAPYLTLDSDPYPAVVDGRIQWIIDGYTTTDQYPYSKATRFSTTNDESNLAATNQINYIRNSVKATVDAYDGSVKIYAWDPDDPILQTWEKVFPGTVEPYTEMSGELMSHVRYPTDLFKVQRAQLGSYHVTDAGSFYSQEDAWVTPNDPQDDSTTNKALQSPYYLSMKLPGEDESNFTLYSTYIPISQEGQTTRNVLTGYFAANSDAGDEDGVKADTYGKLTLLTLPRETTVPGPGQVQNQFDSSPDVTTVLNLLNQGGSKVENGNLLTLPVGGGLLYVQPVYVRSSGDTSYPLLQKVLVAFGERIAFEDTLSEALDELFGGDSGAATGDQNIVGDTEGVDTDTGTSTGDTSSGDTDATASPSPSASAGSSDAGSSGSSGSGSSSLDEALQDAKSALEDREQARVDGDWSKYGEADQRLQDALERAITAEQQ